MEEDTEYKNKITTKQRVTMKTDTQKNNGMKPLVT